MTSSSQQKLKSASEDHSNASIRRDAWLEIDLNKLEVNVNTIKVWLEEQSAQTGVNTPHIMAVIKADAYGHGAVPIAEVLAACGVTYLGVASADEGSSLRQGGCKLPILILGPTPSWAVASALKQNLQITVSSLNQLQELIKVLAKYERPVPLHLKVDTGMHRLGMNINDTKKAIELLSANKKFKLVSVFSHLGIPSSQEKTLKQKQNFDQFIALFKGAKIQPDFYHLASSEAIKQFPHTYYDMVRIGIYIYGLEGNSVSSQLLPIMSVCGRINQISFVDKGEAIGYGFTWRSNRPTRLANIPIGYADGVDRRLSNKMHGLLHGQLINQVGTISMDQMLFDITDIPQAKEGDVITIIGADDFAAQSAPEKNYLYLINWANQLNTMTRELACRLKIRLPRIYIREQTSGKFPYDALLTALEKGIEP